MGYSKSQEYDGGYYPDSKPQKAKIPKALQASIASYKGTATAPKDDRDGIIHRVTIGLKNATAFGQPITKIQYLSEPDYGGHGSDTLTVYFAKNDFVKLKPQFPLVIGDTKYPIGTSTYYYIQQDEQDYEKFFATKISKAQKDEIALEQLAETHQNGWQMPTDGVGLVKLTFNSKNKSIVCYDSY